MKPPAFQYLRPETIETAVDALAARGDETMVLAGGQSLVPRMNVRSVEPQTVVDINGLETLNYIRKENNTLAIGALTRQSEARQASLVSEHCPLITDALQYVGHTPTRHRGTIGGSMANADPRAELPTVANALDASFVVRSSDEERTIDAGDFFAGNMETAVGSNELLTEIRVPVLATNQGYSFVENSILDGDWAIVGVAATVEVDDGRCQNLQIAYAGVDNSPTCVPELRETAIGEHPNEKTFRDVAAQAREYVTLSAQADASTEQLRVNQTGGGKRTSATVHADAAYKRDLVETLTYRALMRAAKRSQQGAR